MICEEVPEVESGNDDIFDQLDANYCCRIAEKLLNLSSFIKETNFSSLPSKVFISEKLKLNRNKEQFQPILLLLRFYHLKIYFCTKGFNSKFANLFLTRKKAHVENSIAKVNNTLFWFALFDCSLFLCT